MKYISSENLKAILTDLLAKVQANINTAAAGANKLDVKIVASLPTADISATTIYLMLKPAEQQTTGDMYDEYMYVNSAWEKFGDVSIDLSNYDNKQAVTDKINAALTDYAKTADVTTAIAAAVADKVTAAQVDAQISTALQELSADDITALKTELGLV